MVYHPRESQLSMTLTFRLAMGTSSKRAASSFFSRNPVRSCGVSNDAGTAACRISFTSLAEVLLDGVPGAGSGAAGGGRARKASKSQICLKTSRLRW